MRKVLTGDLKPGMRVAKTLYVSDGRILLNSGVILKEAYIRRLKEKDIPAVYIMDETLPEVEVPEFISDQTRLQTAETLRGCMNSIDMGTELNARKIKKTVNEIVDELTSKRHVIVHLNDIRAYDDYTFGHSVSVTALSILTGISLGYNKLELRDLGVGALLHDAGKIKIDESILLKPSKLTENEFEEVKQHPRIGYDLIKETDGISFPSAHIAYQHHEKYNGSGYPRGLKGDDILEFAQIVAVADIYDAITTDRVYRKALPAHKALEVMHNLMQAQLNPDIAQMLFKNVAVYPIGSVVELNTGELGIVVDVNKEDLSAPVVRIIKGDEINQDEITEIDLMHNKGIIIKDVITDRKKWEDNK
ncbi:HD-GYP domain-containing protein [Selenihalanaerobacter shriftii]|uniref:HD-GYP domain, c-di-GMP phosphodiesterase class II (Or its inactivated variant) n=1 Tax=Selenihalanaerobacter shriftii TaxID=142842 RepID=A0A1T4KS20_9FIRM|nr:HD-GYP domain-containing protein [Selenihalanaerobacter shriftii]SJZ45138.1 HD-GYP domain, c-di-GMP phosphodiesterase class II (or its inactivated variant) [Selenihalanaerobacter shriftii]